MELKRGLASQVRLQRIEAFLFVVESGFSQGADLSDAERRISGLPVRKKFPLFVDEPAYMLFIHECLNNASALTFASHMHLDLSRS